MIQRDAFDELSPPTRLVMCPPRYLSTRIPNNVFMKRSEPVNVGRAMTQFTRTQHVLNALNVETLNITPVAACQDQVYVANVAVAIDPYIILANYKAPGRSCEVEPARKFYEDLGYTCIQPPFHFEGEADIKKLTDGVYFGGWGQFTDQRTHDWITEQTGARIIPIHEVSEKLYHLDCSLLIIDEEHAVVTADGIDAPSLRAIEQMVDVTITPRGKDIVSTGITNAVLVPEKRICLSGAFNPEKPEYRTAMEWMNATFDKFEYSCVFLDVDEYDKSGADLSCSVMHIDFYPDEDTSNDGQNDPTNQRDAGASSRQSQPRDYSFSF